MVSCGTNSTGSEDKELSVLDLLLRQDNFGDADSDGISDDFGTEYNVPDYQQPIHSHGPNGECIKDVDPEQIENEENSALDETEPDDDNVTPDPPIPVVNGCTNPQAENYNPNATEDDGSCIIPTTPPDDPPTADPDLSAYAEFLTVVTKAEAEAQATHGYFYPKSYKDQQGGVEKTNGKTDEYGRYIKGVGKINCKYMGERTPYYSSPGDGSDGYFKWIELYNYKDTSFWFPEPRPFYMATKYWRNGGYENRSRQIGHSVGCNQQVVKDGMYTAGKCPDVEEIVIHTTGIQNCKTQRDPLRHSAGAMCNDPYQPYKKNSKGKWIGTGASTMPYHWQFRKDGWCAQMMPDWRYGAGVGGRSSNGSDNRNIGITWMTYNDPVGTGGYPTTGNRAMTISELGGFNGKYRGCFPSNAQIINMAKLIAIYIKRYPNINITGHHQYKSKHCPNFWIPAWIAAGGIPGLNQAGIDKLIKEGGEGENGDKYKGYGYYSSCSYGEAELLTFAGEELAKISNPAGIGGGSIPVPSSNNSNTSNPNIPQPLGKRWQDMDCAEFTVYHNDNWKNISPSIRTGRMNSMSDEDREDLMDRTRECIE